MSEYLSKLFNNIDTNGDWVLQKTEIWTVDGITTTYDKIEANEIAERLGINTRDLENKTREELLTLLSSINTWTGKESGSNPSTKKTEEDKKMEKSFPPGDLIKPINAAIDWALEKIENYRKGGTLPWSWAEIFTWESNNLKSEFFNERVQDLTEAWFTWFKNESLSRNKGKELKILKDTANSVEIDLIELKDFASKSWRNANLVAEFLRRANIEVSNRSYLNGCWWWIGGIIGGLAGGGNEIVRFSNLGKVKFDEKKSVSNEDKKDEKEIKKNVKEKILNKLKYVLEWIRSYGFDYDDNNGVTNREYRELTELTEWLWKYKLEEDSYYWPDNYVINNLPIVFTNKDGTIKEDEVILNLFKVLLKIKLEDRLGFDHQITKNFHTQVKKLKEEYEKNLRKKIKS